MQIFFVSKDSSWQKYRLDILNKLGAQYQVRIEVLTIGKLRTYIENSPNVSYQVFRSWLPESVKPSFFPGALLQIWRTRPDVVLCMMNLSQFTECASLLLCRLLGIHFVWWTHAYDHAPARNALVRNLKQRLTLFFLSAADAVITFSPAGKEFLLCHGFAAERVFCAPNTLDTDRLLASVPTRPRAETRVLLAQQMRLPLATRFVLFSGRLQKRKRVEDAIEAMHQVCQHISSAHFLIVGDGSERTRLEALAQSTIPNHFTFLGSVFDEARLVDIFSAVDVMVLPSSVGLAIVHAFAFGVPIITQSGSHGPEIQYLHEGRNGFMITRGDVAAMADRIRQLLDDSELLEQMSRAARQTVETDANIHLMLQAMATALGIGNEKAR